MEVTTDGVEGQLQISSAEASDSGAYFCQASNLYGRDQQLVQLLVQGSLNIAMLDNTGKICRFDWTNFAINIVLKEIGLYVSKVLLRLTYILPSTLNLKILSLNINSYSAYLAQFELLVAEIKPYIITLFETWLNPDLNIVLEDYTVVRRDRGLINDSGRYIRGGGIACFILKSLKSSVLLLSPNHHINQPEFIFSALRPESGNFLAAALNKVVTFRLPKGPHVLLASIYRRPQGDLLDSFFTEFNKLYSNYSNIIITGDLNCNLLKCERSSNHLKSFITESGLFCVPYGPIYHTNDVDSWLDVIIVDSHDKINNFSKSPTPIIGGHDYLLCDYKFPQPKCNVRSVKFRDFRNQRLDLRNKDVDSLDPSEMASYFISSVTNSLDDFAPFSVRKLNRPKNPWLTNELKSKLKNRLVTNLLRLFKNLRRELKLELNTARDVYLRNALTDEAPESNIWIKLKRLGIVKSRQTSPLDHFDAEQLNNFYARTLTKYLVPTTLLPAFRFDVIPSWARIDIIDVTKSLHLSLAKSSASSPDGLNLMWLKDHFAQISLFLTALFNRSSDQAIFPEAWKSIFMV
ncbi:Protein of unknown function, partial [Cotesia congregata]